MHIGDNKEKNEKDKIEENFNNKGEIEHLKYASKRLKIKDNDTI